jgi:CBS domain-containing protein
MLAQDIMTRDVQLLAAHDAIQAAARRMRDDNIGSLPVADGDRLQGYVTDRDLVVRGLAQGLSADTHIHDVMTDKVLYCFEHEDVEDVAANMAHNRVRRLPVLSREKRLLGIVALGDLATKGEDTSAEDALKGVPRPTR